MNRKEIIVFSVFVNSVLLVALFIFALRPTLKGEMNIRTNDAIAKTEKEPAQKKSELDQVDQILKEYIAKKSTRSEKKQNLIADSSPSMQESTKTKIENANKRAPEVRRAESSPIEVIVRQGDVLEKIARRHRTTVREIMHLNNMKGTKLRIGQIILVKENTRKKIPMNASPVKTSKSSQRYYTVKNGDSPWTIAIKNHIKVTELLRLNGLNEAKAKRLKPGDKLRIR